MYVRYALRWLIGRALCHTGRHNDTCPRGTSEARRHMSPYVRWSPITHAVWERRRSRW